MRWLRSVTASSSNAPIRWTNYSPRFGPTSKATNSFASASWPHQSGATATRASTISPRSSPTQLYANFSHRTNARGGRWQVALYSFIANHGLGHAVGASADGRLAGESLTRNLNPSWGTDHNGPTAVLQSLSAIDFTRFPDGCALDLRFDPALFTTPEGRDTFAGFLKGFVKLGVMQMQISMVDTETLLDARAHPERWPNLMVKVAGFSARFVDLSDEEKDEIINRTMQRV